MNDPLFSIVDTEVFIMNLTVLSVFFEWKFFKRMGQAINVLS